VLHQLARFRSVVPYLEELGGGTVLDVGSGSEGVASWLDSRFAVTAVDTSFEDIGAMRGPEATSARRVVGDIRELPFGDREFDAVFALDVLEHVEPADRGRAVAEIVRTARRRAIVACPAGAAAFDADRRLAAGLRRRGLTPPSWLTEHEACGFPEPEEVGRWLGDGGRVRLAGGENVRWHGWLFTFEFRRPGAIASRAAARRIAAGLGSGSPAAPLARGAARLAEGPRRPPYYRTIAILDRGG
jgi:SAM-dependent methyltransferase